MVAASPERLDDGQVENPSVGGDGGASVGMEFTHRLVGDLVGLLSALEWLVLKWA